MADGSRSRALIALLVAITVAAVIARLPNVDNRVLWKDEAISVLRAAGYTEADFVRHFTDGRLHSVAEMRVYQGRNTPRSAAAVIESAAREDPQHPPLYVLLLFLWQRLFGSSVAAGRALSLLIGIALIPAMYALCLQLFGSNRTALIGAAAIACSPFFIAYSKELREYDLLALCALSASALFLAAAKRGGAGWWIAYLLVSVAGLYANPLFGFVLIAHAAYAVRFVRGGRRAYALMCAVAALLFYSPWIFQIAAGGQTVESANGWSATAWPSAMLVQKWVFNSATAVFDLEYRWPWTAVLLIPLFALMAYAAWYVLRKAPREQRWFIAWLTLPTAVAFAGSDLLLHAHRSAVTRYGVLFYLGELLCAAALLGHLTSRRRGAAVWQFVTILFLCAGLASGIVSAQNLVWWDNHEDDSTLMIASSVNARAKPVLIAPAPWKMVYTLSFRLRDDASIVFPRGRDVAIPADAPLFLVAPLGDAPGYLRVHRTARLQPLYVAGDDALWKTFHKPIKDLDAAWLGANNVKLSLWKVSTADP